MATVWAREERVRFHNDATLFAVEEHDTKPRSKLHQERMSESSKKAMERAKGQFAEKTKALAAKEKTDAKKAKEISERAAKADEARKAIAKKNAADAAKAEKEGLLYQEPEGKVLLVVRIKGTNNVAPKPRKALELLRLRKMNSAVFVRLNKSTLNLLRICQPWITYGVPTTDMIRNLIYKRGHVRTGVMGHYTNVRIQGNEIVEQVLGKHGIIGIEDLVTEIADAGEHFTAANRALAPFRLSNPSGGFKKKKKDQFTEMQGGECGDRGHYINALVDRMY